MIGVVAQKLGPSSPALFVAALPACVPERVQPDPRCAPSEALAAAVASPAARCRCQAHGPPVELEEVGYLPFPAEVESLAPEFSPVVVSDHRGADWVVQMLRDLERRAFVAWDLETGSVVWVADVESPTGYNPLTAVRVGEDAFIPPGSGAGSAAGGR